MDGTGSRNQHQQQLGKVKRFQKLLSTVFCCAKSAQSDHKLISMHSFQPQDSKQFFLSYFRKHWQLTLYVVLCVNVSPSLSALFLSLSVNCVCYCIAECESGIFRIYFCCLCVKLKWPFIYGVHYPCPGRVGCECAKCRPYIY